ncbi:MAG: hypothetical protein ACYC9S_00755 [Leptospirales bacterium]
MHNRAVDVAGPIMKGPEAGLIIGCTGEAAIADAGEALSDQQSDNDSQ